MSEEDRAGLYVTVIVHLGIVIVMLLSGLGWTLSREESFIMDFSKYEQLEKLTEEKEKLEKEADFKEEISRKLERELADAGAPVRSIAVNRGALKDDRGTDAKQLYEDADRLAKELRNGYSVDEPEEVADPDISGGKANQQESHYSGPSVLDWYLEGRKASHLPIPAYRCMGAGEVKVEIEVNPQGTVTGARIDDSCSSSDGCLRSFAIRASRASRFSKSTTSGARQKGYIIYQFIAQ